ncbi:MAG: UDP-3-O-(3-hydroxymyristoyl)glucosamine N-acyltransferase [Jannaschia helgolandensis]|uniref:UDP-3-O-[3-hydroxymyristoyl] glucosamine N-acyltransferase n=1 Tax=Jannaschia helgolandensis TaxID=188906 RepID=A0A1H7KUG8_9RHOB|nr:UDP-3-O-(3-hydroxymyristoyl)glucosamine N-acyltransferase [Jannaschia helgolandensis]SEK90449.1 UDP-3-O-[3-hydroxymyristoyl] glucosamine N-acyltransferase [Jannaschia helgolandensis]
MFTLAHIAEVLGQPVLGDGSLTLHRAAEPAVAGPDDLALAMSPDYADALNAGQARAAILWDGADWESFGLRGAILVPRARLAMAGVTAALDSGPRMNIGVHPSAIVEKDAIIGEGAAIGPLAVIGAGVRIGARARIAAHVTIAEDALIGDDVLLMSGVRIGSRVNIGDRFIAQPNAVIGGDGFSFVTPEESGVERARKTLGDQGDISEQRWIRIHSLGSVTIGDDVEVGANSAIDKGTVADTTIGRGTKIDNHVQIGHNNRIGEDCLLCGHVGIAGGTTIGNRVVLAGKVGVNDNITIGNDVVAGGGSDIYSRVRDGEVVMGSPAVKMETNMAMYRALRRLPRALEQLASLRAIVMKKGLGDGNDDKT